MHILHNLILFPIIKHPMDFVKIINNYTNFDARFQVFITGFSTRDPIK